jgi:hypothetical protein
MRERQINQFFDLTRHYAVWQSREAVEDVRSALILGDVVSANTDFLKRNTLILTGFFGIVSALTDETVSVWNPQYQSFVDLGMLEQDDLTFSKDEIKLINVAPAETNIRESSNGRFTYNQRVKINTESSTQVLRLKGILADYILGQNVESDAIVIASLEYVV